MKQLLLSIMFYSCGLCFAQMDGGYSELADTKPHDGESVWSKIPSTPQIGWGSKYVRYPKLSVPKLPEAGVAKEKVWKGERINMQAVVWTRSAMSDVHVAVSDLKNGSSVIPASRVRASFVRYVMTDELNKDGKGACGRREDKSLWDSSVVADVLYKSEIPEIKENTAQPIWLTIDVPQDAKTGIYKGVLTVTGRGFGNLALPLEITVGRRVLPQPKDWKFHLDLWQNPYAVARYYQVPLWSEAHFDAMRPIMQMLADAGQKVVTATIMHRPWNGQTEDHFDSMVGKMKKIDGTWVYDYAVFDKWVEFMMGMGIDRQINCYTLIPWALRFDYFDQATGRIQFVEAKPGDAAYEEYWGGFLKDFASHLRSKGWFERTTIAMDERGLDAMREAIKVIRKADKDYKISLAGNYHGEIQEELYDLCVNFGAAFPAEVKAARDEAGMVSTVYTCCAEARPNTFTFSPPAEATWIGWHAAAGGYDGYLRWAYNSWTIDPFRDSRFRTWAAGDCYLVYPGYSSIRMECLIEGVQDYEKIRILRAEMQRKPSRLKALDNLLSRFAAEKIGREDPSLTISAARKALGEF